MLLPGDPVGGFRVTELLGTGAMGQVFGAEALQPEAAPAPRVAIKVLHPDLLDCPDVVLRFRNEVRAAQALRHPGLVSIFGAGELPIGVPYLIMDRLGPSLSLRLVERGRLDEREAAGLGAQLARALAAAHARGIVHRDLKPGNVLYVAPGSERVKVTDFGVAKVGAAALGAGETRPVSTADAAQLGTPAYCAPEQWQDPARVDGRADVYSLGVLLYEVLCGRLPFPETDAGVLMRRHLYEDPPPLPGAPRLGALVLAMLDKAPGRRSPMALVAAQLAALLGEDDGAATA